jgi:UDP-sugar pyrophosphorylase
MSEELEIPRRLQKSIKFITDSQFALCRKLCGLGQAHLFEGWDAMPPAGRRALAEQLETIEKEYADGGLEGYLTNARALLKRSREGVNPLDGWAPQIPVGEAFEFGTKDYDETEAKGLEELGSVGFCLVAGGLGERLGYKSVKVGLPTEMATETRYLHYYIEYILAVQEKYAPEGRDLPLCIMTSGDTNEKTLRLLKYNNYFGMKESQITIVVQGQGVPALEDNDAKMVLMPGEPSQLMTKPHGHGDIHALLHKEGVARKWKENGIKWLCLFQDTNGLAFHTLPLMLGVSVKKGLIMNSLTVPRKAKQAIGGIAKLKNQKTGEFK